MQRLEKLQERYQNLEWNGPILDETAIDPECLLTFPYQYPGSDAEVTIDTDEFTAVCPWTRLPDLGTLTVKYVPLHLCIELKSLKYYLLSYRNVGIVQEHAANRILLDLAGVCSPSHMSLTLDYKTRGGIHTTITVNHQSHGVH